MLISLLYLKSTHPATMLSLSAVIRVIAGAALSDQSKLWILFVNFKITT